jgi:hypothetical protein
MKANGRQVGTSGNVEMEREVRCVEFRLRLRKVEHSVCLQESAIKVYEEGVYLTATLLASAIYKAEFEAKCVIHKMSLCFLY